MSDWGVQYDHGGWSAERWIRPVNDSLLILCICCRRPRDLLFGAVFPLPTGTATAVAQVGVVRAVRLVSTVGSWVIVIYATVKYMVFEEAYGNARVGGKTDDLTFTEPLPCALLDSSLIVVIKALEGMSFCQHLIDLKAMSWSNNICKNIWRAKGLKHAREITKRK